METTCMITIVAPGHSDKVLKVFPAEHETEKIWLDNTPGIERWETIKRMMQLHASRFAPVAEPVPFCNDPKDLKTITLKPDEIPTVKLENFVLPAPKTVAKEKFEPQITEKQWSERFDKLESMVNKIASLVVGDKSEMVNKEKAKDTTLANTEEVKRGPGRPRKE